MHDGWTYVLAAYAVTAAVLAIWFWMIIVKLRRNPPRPSATQERIDG